MKTVLKALLISVLVVASRSAEAKMTVTFGPTKLAPQVKDLARSLLNPAKYVEIALPQVKNVPVVFADCGQANAFYNPGEKKITFCYELVKSLLDNIVKIFTDEDEKEFMAPAYHQAMVFVFFHEVGHAYADLSDADLTGPEEDVADQISTYLMWAINFDEASMLGAYVFFDMASFELEDGTSVDAWDEHTPNARRIANIACWSFGAEPDKARALFDVVGEQLGDAEGFQRRSARCGGEWVKIKKVWDKVVKVRDAGK